MQCKRKEIVLIVAGNLTLDEIIAKQKTYKNMLGGPPAYSVKSLYSVFSVKPTVYSCVGYDFPESFESEIASLSKLYISKSNKPTTRFKLIETNGRQLFMLTYSGEIETIDLSLESVYMFSPVYKEVKLDFLKRAYKVGLVILDPQGYLRVVDDDLRVYLRFNSAIWELLRYVSVLRVSTDEYMALSKGLSIKMFLEKTYTLGVEVAIVTSPKTVHVVSDGKYFEFPTYMNVNVKSTTGAGDVFTAFFAYVYSKNYDVEKALAYAIVASSFAVENIGPSSIDRKRFFERLREYMELLYE